MNEFPSKLVNIAVLTLESRDLDTSHPIIPFHRASVGAEELNEIAQVLQSGWLTTGPKSVELEGLFSEWKGGLPCVAVNSCTSGLFLAMKALDLQPGDEVITTPYTFVASVNMIRHAGGVPVLADIDPNTLNISAAEVAKKISPRTRAILPVHVAGNPCDMDALCQLAAEHHLEIVEDCAHATETLWGGKHAGNFGMAGAFSFYANKNLTTAEGGMLTCRDAELAQKFRLLLNHGLDKSSEERHRSGNLPLYDVLLPGYKFNLPDVLAAIGVAQMHKLPKMYARRVQLKAIYDRTFSAHDLVRIPEILPKGRSALHLYILLLNLEGLSVSRNHFLEIAKAAGIHLSVHYTPVHLFTEFQQTYGYLPEDFPMAHAAGLSAISLPFYPDLTDLEAQYVVETMVELLEKYRK